MTVELRTWRSSCGQVEVVVEETSNGFTMTGFRVWSAAGNLSELLCKNRALVQGMNVLEVGAGCGLCSAVAASLGGRVLATDRLAILPRLTRTSSLGTDSQNFDVAELDWDLGLPISEGRHFDIILGSDVTYGSNCHQVLLTLLWQLCSESSTVCLLAHCVRSEEQTADLWHDIVRDWPGLVWLYDSYDVLVSCHRQNVDRDAGSPESTICFALSVAAPCEGSALYEAYAAFVKASEERPLNRPKPRVEIFEEGMIGPQLPCAVDGVE